MPVLGVIPARLGSTRLANKPLQTLGGAPLVVRVWERAVGMGVFEQVVVATDAPEVRDAVARVGGRVVMTSPHHESGTDRVAEVALLPEFAGSEVIVNVQGDEPFLPEAAVTAAVGRIASGDDIGTVAVPLDPAHLHDPAVVKVVTDAAGRALYFSRAPIPYPRDGTGAPDGWWRHLGVYACRRDALWRWVKAPPSTAERIEKLEQLRALDLGLSIGVARLAGEVLPGIDTPADLARAERHWQTLVHEGR